MPDITSPATANRARPLHVILAAYPIACFTGAFVTDLVYARTYEMMWADFSAWLIVVGVLAGVLAAIVGAADYLWHRRERAPRPTRWHSALNGLALVLAVVNAFIHSHDAYTSVMPNGLILSGIVALLVLAASWIGTTLAVVRGERVL